jgi:hypothetical protein
MTVVRLIHLSHTSADFPWAPNPSSSANFFTAGKAFLSEARLYSTTLVRRWNWSTVRPPLPWTVRGRSRLLQWNEPDRPAT